MPMALFVNNLNSFCINKMFSYSFYSEKIQLKNRIILNINNYNHSYDEVLNLDFQIFKYSFPAISVILDAALRNANFSSCTEDSSPSRSFSSSLAASVPT